MDSGKVGCWLNCKIPFHEGTWDADLVIAEPDESTIKGPLPDGLFPPGGAAGIPQAKPDGRTLRLVMEHKSIITAHRNRINRFKELDTDVNRSNDAGFNVIVAATVLVGTAPRVLQVVDGIRKLYKVAPNTYDEERFELEVGRRLRNGDPSVWEQFAGFVSTNRPRDAENTIAYFRRAFPLRSQDRVNQRGMDAIMLAPVYYDNVGTARVDRENALGTQVDEEYAEFVATLSTAYARRWGSVRLR